MGKLTTDKRRFQKGLLAWYRQSARDLPWRKSPSAYKTVVSEFMLQQTQVATALPYFERWLRDYPDFNSLAKATEEKILKSWEGLGYYNRARNLHALAKEIAKQESLPESHDAWLALPGIGPYTAAAISSIAFNASTACVDGNVVRILARLTGDTTTYRNSSEAAKAYTPLAQKLLNENEPGDHNQAMMELGATLCRKRKPQCLLCPVSALCAARQQGIEENIPSLEKTKAEKLTVNRAWIQSSKGILLHKKSAKSSRMKGLHELPTLEQAQAALPKKAEPILTKQRSITKYRIIERIFAIEPSTARSVLPENCLWASKEEMEHLPFSGPHRRWIDTLLKK